MAKLTLADIQDLASVGNYGGTGLISPASVVLGLSAAAILYDLSLWQGAGYELTQSEIDDIEAMIAGLENDLMLVGDFSVMYAVKVGNSGIITIPPSTGVGIPFDSEFYDPQDMHNTTVNNHRINIKSEGLYQMEAHTFWYPMNLGYIQLELYKYDTELSTIRAVTRVTAPSNQSALGYHLQLSYQGYARVGDYYWLVAYQTDVATRYIYKSRESPSFAMFEVR